MRLKKEASRNSVKETGSEENGGSDAKFGAKRRSHSNLFILSGGDNGAAAAVMTVTKDSV
jgi:hypothetical protein